MKRTAPSVNKPEGPKPASPPHPATQPGNADSDKQAYGQMLKSSAVIGGSSLLNIAIGVVRTKVMAVLLGPAGFGLMSLYSAILELANTVASMGINSSGVRQMAEAVGSGDMARVALTAAVLRRMSLLLGLLGAGLLVVSAGPLSTLTFAEDKHSGSVALLSLAVFFACLSGGQSALIQGMRRIADLAWARILGAVLGTAAGIALVFFLGEQGVVPSLVAIAAMAALASWWYGHRVPIDRPSMKLSQVRREAAALLKLGVAFMASALMMSGTAYVVRLILLRQAGVEAAGLYQAAWTLGGLYLGFILQAMGADYYPRLTGVAKDHVACNRLVNQQAQISLLLAGPGILATLTFAPLVLALFYTSGFAEAVGILRWICLGMTLRIVIWPVSFIMLAKGAKGFFVWTEAAWTIVHVGLAWVGVRHFGPDGAGIAFFASNTLYGLLIFPIARRLTGFAWTSYNRRACLLLLSTIALVFSCLNLFPPAVGMAIGATATVLGTVFSLRALAGLVSLQGVQSPLLRWLARFRLHLHTQDK